MHSLPLAGNSNLLLTTPTIVPGLAASGTAVAPWLTANTASGAGLAAAVASVNGMLYDAIGANWRLAFSARSFADGANGQDFGVSSPFLWNGASYDKERNNHGVALLASAARTVDTDSPVINSYNARAVILYLNISAVPAVPGVGGLKVGLICSGPLGETQFFMLAAPAAFIQSAGVYGFAIGVGLPAAIPTTTTLSALVNVPIPNAFFVRVSVGDAQSYTYSLSAGLSV